MTNICEDPTVEGRLADIIEQDDAEVRIDEYCMRIARAVMQYQSR